MRHTPTLSIRLGICLCVIAVSIATAEHPPQTLPSLDLDSLQTQLLSIIADKNCSSHNLDKAIEHLGHPVEQNAFWRNIFNSTAFSLEHRQKCLLAFLRRKAYKIGSLEVLARELGKPSWLDPKGLEKIDVLTGSVPLHFIDQCTIFRMKLIASNSYVYLSIQSEKIDTAEVADILLGKTPGRDVPLADVGVAE